MSDSNELVVATELAPAVHTDRDAHLSDRARERIAGGVAKNTTRAYARQWAAFEAWCAREGRTALPATAETLAEYVTVLADHGVPPVQVENDDVPGKPASNSTIEQAMAAVRTMHRTAGFKGQPDTDAALLVLRDHRRNSSQRTKKATPILIDELRAMIETCDPSTLQGMRDHALLVLGIAMFGRRSEMVALELDDLSETSEGLVVLVRKSKTDQDAKGREIPIPYGQHAATCPVRVMRAWVATLAEHGITEGRVLRSVNRPPHIGKSLSGVAVDTVVKERAIAAKLPNADGYSAHSLRAGGATLAAIAGHPISAIAEHGGWSATSPVVIGYVRQVDRWRNNPLHGTGL